MIVDERRERFDSVTITLVVTSVVIWGLLNWPYSYVSTAHRYEQPPSLTEYSIETFLFAKYEVLQGGFPFTYLTRYEDDLPSRPTFWSPQRLGANIAIAILATLSVGAIAFFLRRLLEKSNGVQTPSRACRLSSRVGIACVTLVILTLLAKVHSRYSAELDLTKRLAVQGSVHRYTLVPKPLAKVFPGFVLQRFGRIRGVMTWDSSAQTMSQITNIPTLTSFSSFGFAPTAEQLSALTARTRINHLQVQAATLDQQFLRALTELGNLRSLELIRCSGLDGGLPGIERLTRLIAINLTNSDVRLSLLPASGWPNNLNRLRLSRQRQGSDSLTLRGLAALQSLSVCRTDDSFNPDVVHIVLSDLPRLEYLGIETLQKFSLHIDSAPRLDTIGYSDPEIGLRVRTREVVPTSMWIESLRLQDVPSLRSLALDGLDLKELVLRGVPSLTRLSIGRFGYSYDLALRPFDPSTKPQLQTIIHSLGDCQGPRDIDLSSLPLAGLDLSPLANNERIRSLKLRDCGIDGSQLAALHQLPRLTELDLRGCPITDREATQLLHKRLPLTDVLVSSDQFEFIEVINQPKLRSYIATDSLRAKRVHISDSPQLEAELILGDDVEELRIQDGQSLLGLSVNGPLPTKCALHGLQSLRFFAVGGPRVDDHLCRHLWRCADLDHLTIAYGRLSRESLKKVGRFSKLTVLALPGSEIDDDVVTRHWSNLKQLSDINLSDTAITSQAVQRLINLRNIQKLAINHCKVDKTELRDLVKIDQLIELEVAGIGLEGDTLLGCLRRGMLDRLNLSYSNIDEAAMQVLASPAANSLVFLGLKGCGLNEVAIRRIADSHPRLALDIAINEVSEEFVNELRQQNRLLDHHDRDGFLRQLSEGAYRRMADIKAEFDPVRGRINSYQFVAHKTPRGAL